ncbi:hypothetical protein Q9233_007106 [Columba guinea]|nr:hypothetical protein Q9233_007106 [Columba guinea]
MKAFSNNLSEINAKGYCSPHLHFYDKLIYQLVTHLSPFEQKKDEQSLMRQGSLRRQGPHYLAIHKTAPETITMFTQCWNQSWDEAGLHYATTSETSESGLKLATGVDSSGSTSSLHAACEKRAAHDAAFGRPVEERSLQTSTKQPWSKGDCANCSEESSSKGNAPTCFRFLKRLWAVTESDRFESIWWGDNGKCIVINEDLFEEEVLARRDRLKIFESETMRSFTDHLRQHGFTRKLGIFPKSGSRSDLLTEEAAREGPRATMRLNYMKTWTSGLSLTTLVQLLNSFPVANRLACFGTPPGCEVKGVFAELKLNNAEAALAGEEEMKPDLFTYEITQKSCMLDGICDT